MIITIDKTSKHSTLLQRFTSLDKPCDIDSGASVLGNMKKKNMVYFSQE